MQKLFGTDGMRGAAGEFPLDAPTIYVVGKSIARQLTEKSGSAPQIIIGRDTRESGAWMEKAFCAGARSENAECISAEVMTTPGVAFLTKNLAADAGVVISASHNPFGDNGIKIFAPDGKKIDEITERRIETNIFSQQSSAETIVNVDEQNISAFAGELNEIQTRYFNYLAAEFSELSLAGKKIIVDCANGASSVYAPKLFRQFGADVKAINCQPNGRNINENCGSLHLENLQTELISEKADFGVAFDGDADRALFVDENGALVDGDATLWVMANHFLEHGALENKTVVATVMSNIGLELALQSKNIKLLRTGVGDKYVLEELLKTGSAIGGEQSGHIIFPQRSLVGDGIYTALTLLAAIQERKSALSNLVQGFTQYPQILVNIKVREKLPFADVPAIAEAASVIEAELAGKGRLLLRYSGTENLARVMIEGENQLEIERQAQTLAAIIRQTIGS